MERTKILFGNDSNRVENSASNNQSVAQNSRLNKPSKNSNSNSMQNLPATTANSQIQTSSNLNEGSKQLLDILKSTNNAAINRDELINLLKSCSKSEIQTVIGLVSQDVSSSGDSNNTTLIHNASSSASLSSLVSKNQASSDAKDAQAQLTHQSSYEAKSIHDNSGTILCISRGFFNKVLIL
jgi:hypothetical protein